MCGIAGIMRFDNQPIDRNRAEALLARVRHRGGDGEAINEHPGAVMVNSRLSIIDPPGGAQPMFERSSGKLGNLEVVFNGEIYNHRQLRKLLEKLGHTFTTDHSDTEVLLHGYRQWGSDLPKRLEGMFAFALFDGESRELFLCRDRAGKKPLYFWHTNQQVTYASVAAALMADIQPPGNLTINPSALAHYLRFGFLNEHSLISGIREVRPAQWIRIDGQGNIQAEDYWQLPAVSKTSTKQGLVPAIRELIQTAVMRRLESDVPFGCFLSGGIDSAVIAAVACRLLESRGDQRLKTYCVGMPSLGYDERPYARQVAQEIGSDHTELEATPKHVLENLDHLVGLMGEPTSDTSILPMYMLCQSTQDHIRVALAGHGGDELFGGYDRYRALRLLHKHGWWLKKVSAISSSDQVATRTTHTRRLLRAASGESTASQYLRMIELFTPAQLRDMGADAAADISLEAAWPDVDDSAKAAMHWDLRQSLPYRLLRSMDRASMALPLEVRCPLLDVRIYELAAHLPSQVLMPGGQPKRLLREAARELVPEKIIRRPKRDFGLPFAEWMRQPLKDEVTARLMQGSLPELGLQTQATEKLLQEHQSGKYDHTTRLFALLTLNAWYDWLKQTTAGSVSVSAS